MKTQNKTTRNPKLYSLLIILGFAAILSSCSKDNSTDVSAGVNASVMIVNSAEGSQPQDFYLSGSKVNTQAVAYTQNSSYISTTSGSGKTAEFKNSGSTTANTTTSATLESGKYYTFYYTGTGSSTSSARTEDDMTAPPSGKAKVRYINLNSTATTNVDFSLNGTTLGSNVAYKSATGFSTVDPGVLTFKLLAAGTSNLYFNMPFTLEAGKIYTIWVTGSTVTTAHIIAHN